MDRREALKLLTAIPAVSSIEVARVQPNDVIVLEYDGVISERTHERMMDYLRQVWPEPQRILILSDGIKLRIDRPDA